ncbi:hypothetical protein [Polaribacter aestuariivivens]|uniref:hypothetical protein n=1 Tax=Polaribacter aestuariivivens TaxID=2304626 RepID=UPI003F49605E
MKSGLELPITLSVPELKGFLDNDLIRNRLHLRQSANIVEGYKLIPNNPETGYKELAFDFYAEINIDNSKLWSLFLLLCIELPKKGSLIFGEKGYELYHGKDTIVNDIIAFLKPYRKQIIADAFIEIGLISHTEDRLVEVLIDSAKYIKFWGVDLHSFQQIMQTFGLKEREDIKFVDEYPLERKSLQLFDKNVTNTTSFLTILQEQFL